MNVESKRLLVVDDNPINVEMLLDLLDDHGFDNLEGVSDWGCPPAGSAWKLPSPA
nr:response regulator [Halomonas socia]